MPTCIRLPTTPQQGLSVCVWQTSAQGGVQPEPSVNSSARPVTHTNYPRQAAMRKRRGGLQAPGTGGLSARADLLSPVMDEGN